MIKTPNFNRNPKILRNYNSFTFTAIVSLNEPTQHAHYFRIETSIRNMSFSQSYGGLTKLIVFPHIIFTKLGSFHLIGCILIYVNIGGRLMKQFKGKSRQ